MRNPRPAATEHSEERGTASMEALLCLPFLLLIFALAINVGYGWLARQRAQGAARFAGDRYLARLEVGVSPEEAGRGARREARVTWYDDDPAVRVDVSGSGTGAGGVLHLGRGGAASLTSVANRVTGRQQVGVRAPRQPPTDTLLPSTPVVAGYTVDGNPWSYAEVPLSFSGLTDVERHDKMPDHLGFNILQKLKYAGKTFFWLLGMEA